MSLGLHRSDCVRVGSLTPRLAAAQGEGGGGGQRRLLSLRCLACVAWIASAGVAGLRCSAGVAWLASLARVAGLRRWLASLARVAGSRRSARVARLASLARVASSRCSARIWVGPQTRWLALCTRGPGGMGGAAALALLGLHLGWAADASACAAYSRPRRNGGWAAALALLGSRLGRAADALARAACSWPGGMGDGQRRSRCLAHVTGGQGRSWGGAAALTSLDSHSSVWRVVGGSVLAGELAAILGRQQLFIGSCASARLLQVGVGAGGLEGRCGWASTVGRWRGRVTLSQSWQPVLVTEGGDPTINMTWKGGTSNHFSLSNL